jgi:quinoprotein dehydrogenase-associated probable ABC transporter substrate-binding protein
MTALRALLGFWLVAALLAGRTETAHAQSREIIDRTQLRVCADPDNLPFSNEKGEGFENKVAALLGEELKLPVSYVFFPQVTGFVRNTLRARNCDLIMGAVVGDDIVQTTNPYYYSAYVAVYPKEKGFAFHDFSDPKLRQLKLGIVSATPPANPLMSHNLLPNTHSYALVVDTRFDSPAHQMLDDLVKGEIDVGFLWGPIAGYYIKRDKLPLALAVLPNEPGAPRMEYRIAMGVRANEPEWRRRINAAILKLQPRITTILQDYGVPLLDEQGRLTNPP